MGLIIWITLNELLEACNYYIYDVIGFLLLLILEFRYNNYGKLLKINVYLLYLLYI
jgi:hypothetical protein